MIARDKFSKLTFWHMASFILQSAFSRRCGDRPKDDGKRVDQATQEGLIFLLISSIKKKKQLVCCSTQLKAKREKNSNNKIIKT